MDSDAMLVLFDCEDTLFVGEDELTQPAMIEALARLTGCDIPADAFEEVDHRARPARLLARDAVDERGLPLVDLDEWVALAEELYLDRADSGPSGSWAAAAGAEQALGQIERDGFRLALLTGIPERISRDRLDRVSLERFFPHGQGAFGGEDADREGLLVLALERAETPPHHAVHVGDTSRDISSACAVGMHCIAVAADGEPRGRVRDAAPVVGSMPELVSVLRDLRSTLGNGHRETPTSP